MRRLTLPTTLLLGLAAACGADPKDGEDTTTTTPTEYEGDAAGECEDGADNDRDALFDCDDDDCAGSPDCDGDACEAANARTSAKIQECLPDLPPSDDTDLPEPPPDCTPTLQALAECMADCADAADCGAFSGSDIDAALAFSECLTACTDANGGGDTDTDTTAGDTAGVQLGGFTTQAFFGYDPAADVARGYLTSTGTPVDVTFEFIFFTEDYPDSGDVDDTCSFLMTFDGTVPRASWAGAGSGYLFGFEVDPADATLASDCDDLFGSGATNDLYDDIVVTGVWGVAVAATIESDTSAAIVRRGYDPAEFLGGGFYTDADVTPDPTWPGYTSVYEANASYQLQLDAGQPILIDGADAIQDRSNNTIPTPQTPIAAVYTSDTFVLWVFN